MSHAGRLLDLWQRLAGSLWFLPGLIVLACGALAGVLVEVSTRIDDSALRHFPRLFGADAGSSRSMLSAIAGSMITVAGVTFSVTVVAVSQASSQYTPRVLRNFLRDRPSQLALGVLVGVFVYCLVVIRTIRGEDESFVPSVAVLTAFVLALVAISLLMYFIHHIASTLEVGTIVSRVSAETIEAVEELFPQELGNDPEVVRAPPELEECAWFPVVATQTGYIQNIDAGGMLDLAIGQHVLLRLERTIGEFVAAGTPLVSVADHPASEEMARAVNELFAIHSYRTVYQDPAFGLRQMADIAVKGLSPGVNDPTTALSCVDYIGAVLVQLVRRAIPSPYRRAEGEIRVIAPGRDFASLLGTALDEIRRNARGQPRILLRMLETLAEVAERTDSPRRLQLLREHANRILRVAERTVPDPDDLDAIRRAHHAVRNS